MKPMVAILERQVILATQTGYLLADAELAIIFANDLIVASCPDAVGRSLTEVFPELVGVELLLLDILHGQRPFFTLHHIQRQTAVTQITYLDLHIEQYTSNPNYLLIIVTNATTKAQQAQRLQQQRNDLNLLAAKLQLANEQLAYVLERFVPTPVAKEIVAAQQQPRPGQTAHSLATILFADMRNFSQLAEAFAPEQTLEILNQYLSVVIDTIHQHEGSVIQIVGDMVMATFNVPQLQPDHANRAVTTATQILVQLQQFVATRKPDWMPTVGFGLGLATGFVTAGYLGARQRYRYAVVGDATNVAYHLCARATVGQILVSEAVLDALQGQFPHRGLGTATLKSRREPVAFYEILFDVQAINT